jgi:hypothetical protein
VIKCITRKVDHERRSILNFEDNNVSSYQARVLNQLYHFKEAQVKVTLEWIKEKNEYTNFLSIMKEWWSQRQFREKPSPIEWKTYKFIKNIQIIVIMLENVFRRKDASSVLEKWIRIFHQVITHGSILN